METKSYQPTEIDEIFRKERTLKGVIESIENDLYQAGKVLCRITVNGMTLTPEDEIKFEETPRREIEAFEIASQPLIDLIRESRQSVSSYFAQLKEASIKASEALRAGVVRDASEIIQAIVDGTSWITDMLNQIRNVDPGFLSVQREWIAAEGQFIRISRDLLAAFEKNDAILLADTLEYEWSEVIDQWLNVLSLLDKATSK